MKITVAPTPIAITQSSIAVPTPLKSAFPIASATAQIDGRPVQLSALGLPSESPPPTVIELLEHGEPIFKLITNAVLGQFGQAPVVVGKVGWIILDLSWGGVWK
jgi:hypothetical protein